MGLAGGIARDQFPAQMRPFGVGQGRRHTNGREAVIQPVQMFTQAKRTRTIDGNHFVDGIAEQKCAIQGRHPRLRQGQVLAVQVASGKRPRH